MSDEFVIKPAKRERVPLLVGLVGPSGAGKTYSALELATGMQSSVGGKIVVIDTEADRALHYADHFVFDHMHFAAPFTPSRYLAAVKAAMAAGARTIVIDSTSHLHEGIGGILEMHEAELTRMAGDDYGKREKCKMAAWIRPKSELRKLLNALLQLQVNIIFCFRAKEKMDLKRGEQPKVLGFMPIAGEEMIYEMTINMLLYPNSQGIPCWQPDEMGEKAIIKLPRQFVHIFGGKPVKLSREIGAAMAQWAAGDVAQPLLDRCKTPDFKRLIALVDECGSKGDIDATAALLDACVARLSEQPPVTDKQRDFIRTAWSSVAPDLHTHYPDLSAKLELVGCPKSETNTTIEGE